MPKLSEIHQYETLDTISAPKWKAMKEVFATSGLLPNPTELVDSSVLVGVEIEVENCGSLAYPHWSFLWRSETDNSLRDNGIELVSVPMKGEQIQYAVNMIPLMLRDTVRFSPRTSIHVHMNVRDMSPEDVAKMTLVYLTVEKLLFRFAGEYREKNIFCVPLYALGMLDNLFHQLNGLDKKVLNRIQSQELRYSAMNFEPLFSFGTVEFRHLGGTRDANSIMAWLNMLMRIRRYALQKTMSDLIEEIIALNSNSHYRGYAQAVFGEQFWSLGATDVDGDVEQGVLAVKKTILSQNFYRKLQDGTAGQAPAAKAHKLAGASLTAKTYIPQDAPAQPARPVPRARPVRLDMANEVANPWVLPPGEAVPRTPRNGETGDGWQESEGANHVIGTVPEMGGLVLLRVGRELPVGYWDANDTDRRLFRRRAVDNLLAQRRDA